MKNSLQLLVLNTICAGILLQSCKPGAPSPPAGPLALESLKIERKNGPDCDKPDTLIFNCAHVNFNYPALKDGSDSLRQAVNAWAHEFMTSWVSMAEEPDNQPPLEDAINSFFNMHTEQVKEMPDGPAYYEAETTDTVLLNDGKYLTLKLDGYSYTGGAHPNASAAVATWDVAAAKKITPDMLVTDLNALQLLAEKKFREQQADAFANGFNFDETSPFKLADNIGLLKDGLYFCYVPYEVGSYAMGFTEFVLPFSEIPGIKR